MIGKNYEIICLINNCHMFFPFELHADLGLTIAFLCTQNSGKVISVLVRYQDFDF